MSMIRRRATSLAVSLGTLAVLIIVTAPRISV